MFNVGDTVVCSNGVCRIEEIGPLAGMGKSAAGRTYYTLRPCFDNAATIYVPVDGDDDPLRFALDREEVRELMDEIEDLVQIRRNGRRNTKTPLIQKIRASSSV